SKSQSGPVLRLHIAPVVDATETQAPGAMVVAPAHCMPNVQSPVAKQGPPMAEGAWHFLFPPESVVLVQTCQRPHWPPPAQPAPIAGCGAHAPHAAPGGTEQNADAHCELNAHAAPIARVPCLGWQASMLP